MTPKNWRDLLAIPLIIGLPVYWAWLLKAGVDQQALLVIVGAGIAWVGDVIKFYYRKAGGPQE